METNIQNSPILIVDNNSDFVDSIELSLRSENFTQIKKCASVEIFLDSLIRETFSMLVLNLQLPGVEGTELLEYVKENYPELPVLIVTDVQDINIAVDCISKGAENFLLKPLNFRQFIIEINRIFECHRYRRLQDSIKERFLSGELKNPEIFRNFTTHEPKFYALFQYIEGISMSVAPVIIEGETGVGKGLLAECLHAVSKRKGHYIHWDVSGMSDDEFVYGLLGTEKVKGKGVTSSRQGMIRRAHEGTLFIHGLDEISVNAQTVILRIISDGQLPNATLAEGEPMNTRIIVGVSPKINKLLETGKFRKDLYYKLKFHHIVVPPLRDRKKDMSILLDGYLKEAANILNKKVPTYPRELILLLQSYHFPGNLPELKAMVFEALSSHQSGRLSLKHFQLHIKHKTLNRDNSDLNFSEKNLRFSESNFPSIQLATKLLIEKAMKKSGNNQAIAARMLGISRQALNKRLKGSKQEV